MEARSAGKPSPETDAPKPSCHSDFVDPEEAKKVQAQVFVQLNTLPAHNLAGGDRLI